MTYTAENLNTMTLAQLATIYRQLSGNTTFKKFGSKALAVTRIMKIVDLLNTPVETEELSAEQIADQIEEIAKPPVETKKTTTKSKLTGETVVGLTGKEPKINSAVYILTTPCGTTGSAKVEEIINHFIANFKQKRGHTEVTEKFARDYITGAIRNGFLKVAE